LRWLRHGLLVARVPATAAGRRSRSIDRSCSTCWRARATRRSCGRPSSSRTTSACVRSPTASRTKRPWTGGARWAAIWRRASTWVCRCRTRTSV